MSLSPALNVLCFLEDLFLRGEEEDEVVGERRLLPPCECLIGDRACLLDEEYLLGRQERPSQVGEGVGLDGKFGE